MSLALSKVPVLRGRAADGFAGAGSDTLKISTEPDTSQQQMTVAFNTVALQGEINHQLMSKMVHVTLNKPYKNDPQATIVLTYGFDEATPVGPDTYRDDGVGSNPVPVSERLMSQGMGVAPRWVKGKPKHWHLRFEKGPLGKCSCGDDPETEVGPEAVMPGPVARHWFGDWDVPAYEMRAASMGVTLDSWLTRPWHRDRVASENWGGYEMDFPPGVPVYDQRGAINYKALRKYGPPEVPHVTITRLDTMMRRLPNTAANVWDIFQWDKACESGARMHFFSNKLDTPGTMVVTQDEIQKMIAMGVQAALAAERAATKGKTA